MPLKRNREPQDLRDGASDSDRMKISRRHFVQTTVAASLACGAGTVWGEQEQSAEVPTRPLGKTGVRVSAIGLGGFHVAKPQEEEETTRIIRSAIDRGITFMDNCWDYNGGQSEIRMGKALRDGYRDRVFLMSKIDGHTREAAARQIDESLKRLQTDHVDLMQFHEVIRPDDPEKILAPGGSMEAMLEAKRAGKVRFIGFTGHKDPAIHLHMLDMAAEHKFHFDTVQMPLNVMDAHFRSFGKQVLPRLVKEKIGVLGMKPLGSGNVLRSHAVTAIECLQYAMTLPTSTVITGMESIRDLDQAVLAATTFKPLSKRTVAAILARTAHHAEQGEFEPFKTTTQFDGTVQNPQWLS